MNSANWAPELRQKLKDFNINHCQFTLYHRERFYERLRNRGHVLTFPSNTTSGVRKVQWALEELLEKRADDKEVIEIFKSHFKAFEAKWIEFEKCSKELSALDKQLAEEGQLRDQQASTKKSLEKSFPLLLIDLDKISKEGTLAAERARQLLSLCDTIEGNAFDRHGDWIEAEDNSKESKEKSEQKARQWVPPKSTPKEGSASPLLKEAVTTPPKEGATAPQANTTTAKGVKEPKDKVASGRVSKTTTVPIRRFTIAKKADKRRSES